ncbi:MAG: aldo/keto reductase [Actinomycetales bacterium]
MQQRFLGSSGLRVSALALGTMGWGTESDDDGAKAQLGAYLAAGGTTVDTAGSYGEGRAEAILGSLLGDVVARSDIVLVSKAGISVRNGRRMVDASRRAMLGSLDASLARLGTDHLDLWLAQRWDGDVPLDETLSALDHAVTTGRVRYAGVSNYSGWQFATAAATAGASLVADQVEFSLLNRAAEGELTEAAEHHGAGILAWAPLGRGVLSGKYRGQIPADSRAGGDTLAGYVEPYLAGKPARITEAVVTAARGLERQALDVSLSWLLARTAVASAVVGARTTAQLQQILKATLEPLPAEITSALDDISAP